MNVTGSLRAKRGIWQMVFDYYDAEGQRKQKSETTKLPEKGNKRKAQKLLEARLKELSQQYATALEEKDILFLSFMEQWLKEVHIYKVKPNTMLQYQYVFDSYITMYKPFHGLKLRDVTPALLQSYYNENLKAGLSPNTIRKHHANIHKCLGYAVRLGLLIVNPAAMVDLPPKIKYNGAGIYTPEQLRKLLELFEGDPLEPVVNLAVVYALRRSEVCGCKWDAIDFETELIHICHTAVIGKGKVIYSDSTKTASSNRTFPLISMMRDYLLELKSQQEENKRLFGDAYVDSGYVCVWPNGEPIRPDYVTQHFRRKLERSDLPVIRFHDLRHSAVYALRQGGCDAKDIQGWLGHSDISTTLNIYGHVLNQDMTRMGQVMGSALFDEKSKCKK